MSKLASLVAVKKAKNVAIQLVDPKNVSQVRPKTVGEMSAAEKARFKREKTGSKKITYQHRRKKRKKS